MDNFIFLYIAVLLLAGLFSTRLMKVLRLPNVTGYIITGIIMGPFVFGLFFNGFDFMGANNPSTSPIYSFVKELVWVNNIALGFIAFSIGSSFKTSALKRVGQRVIWITIFESAMASIIVILGLTIAHFTNPETISWPLVLTLGAIAAATAPAATLMVVKQYKAHGPVVDTLLPTVALDDASALILFAILFQIAKTLATGDSFSIWSMLGKPLCEIFISIGFGTAFGFFITWMCAYFKSRTNRLIWAIFIVF
ncbi:MAG: cation:proton antiporter, partial [Bacilli bacterium]|nr:cation:proton antiporter [Bacilli bacterium]